MKKSLMILASVALGASMASAADVESKNVVGFQTVPFSNNLWKMQAMQFDKIGGGSMKLSEMPINPTNWKNSQIQIAFNQGTTVKFASYFCLTDDPNEGGNPAGWYDGDGEYVGETVQIPVGAAFWLIPKTNDTISFSGEVLADNMVYNFELNKWQMICNPYPVPIKLKDLPFVPATWVNSQIQVAFNQGTTVKFASYFCLTVDPNEGGNPAGWYDGDGEYVGETVEIGVGQGFWFIPKNTGSVTFTSPL